LCSVKYLRFDGLKQSLYRVTWVWHRQCKQVRLKQHSKSNDIIGANGTIAVMRRGGMISCPIDHFQCFAALLVYKT